ncbi:MAG: hypothetical protein Q8R51_02390 [Azonexus sp.]|nr:hypothetical protein [Azonexus sp.]
MSHANEAAFFGNDEAVRQNTRIAICFEQFGKISDRDVGIDQQRRPIHHFCAAFVAIGVPVKASRHTAHEWHTMDQTDDPLAIRDRQTEKQGSGLKQRKYLTISSPCAYAFGVAAEMRNKFKITGSFKQTIRPVNFRIAICHNPPLKKRTQVNEAKFHINDK